LIYGPGTGARPLVFQLSYVLGALEDHDKEQSKIRVSDSEICGDGIALEAAYLGAD
jgi:hypothetical protein